MSSYKKYRVVKKVKESSRVMSLYLTPVTEETPLVYKPGQHLLFRLNVPGQDVPSFRYYSFSDSYHPEYYRVSVKKEPAPANRPDLPEGLCSSWIFDTLKEGEVLEAKGPIGDFVLEAKDNSPVVLIAGGIGITPLLCMIKSVARENPGRKVWLFYGVNERSEHSFYKELGELKRQHPNFHIHTFYSTLQDDDKHGDHYDHEGFVDTEIILRQTNDPGLLHFMCGPPAMMKYISEALCRKGVPAENIFTENFSSAAEISEEELHSSPGKETGNTNDSFLVEFTRSAKTLTWDNRYRSLLEFAEANDIDISSGCLFGDCGTCLTRLLGGEVNYTHATMIKPDTGNCLPCSCIPAGDMRLDA